MDRVDPKINGTYFNMRDLYGNKFGKTTAEETAPESAEHSALTAEKVKVIDPAANHKGILTWLGIILVFVIAVSIKGGL